jgi:hypothetical protein
MTDPFAQFNLKLEKMQKEYEKKLAQSQKDFDQKLKDLGTQANISVEAYQKVLDAAVDDATKKFNTATKQVIETKSIDDANTVWYRTTIFGVGQSITNEFPKKQPDKDDLYWTKHQDLVQNALKTRQDLLNKIIETIGSTVGGLINPAKQATQG